MNVENQIMLLREAEIEPTEEVLEQVLEKEIFNVYQEILKIITSEFDLQYEWRFYKDGKSWLFKAVYKRKTIFWLSAWRGFIKISFFFTEKTRSGIFDLPISGEIKEKFDTTKATGKLIALILDIEQEKQLNDFREIAKYKKSLK
ncbi:DUF3788 domain-containing protein [Bacteroidales bacterium OttesenSCG-928-B11]|nr:DUF3788 domain-containing protein [Bacteroidales bacterium OttesenSCG-928-B11]